MLENFEYTFFDQPIAEKFAAFAKTHNLDADIREETSPYGEASFEVSIKGSLDDEQADVLEEYYSDLLFGEQAAQFEGNGSDGALADACGVQVKLESGEYTTVAIKPEIMNKILSVLTIDELQSFLAQVAEDIENPKAGPICSRKDLPK